MEDKLRSSTTIADLPDEILSEVLFELSVAHQERLRRVSKKWLAELSHARLQRAVRVDLSLTVVRLDRDHQLHEHFYMPVIAVDFLECSYTSNERYKDYIAMLRRVVTSRTEVLQLAWTESTDTYNVMESMTAWWVVWSLFAIIKTTGEGGSLNVGSNITHLLLDNITAPDGLHNLWVLAKHWKGQEVNRWVEYTPVALSTIVFRRCRFEMFGHFMSLYKHQRPNHDCIFERLPGDYMKFARIPLRILRLDKPKSELEEHIKVSAIQSCEQLSPAVYGALTAKVSTLTDKAKVCWQNELIRNESRFKNHECSDVDLNSINWGELQSLTLLFFLSFRSVRDDQ